MRNNFVQFDKLSSNTICLPKERFEPISGNKRCIVTNESDSAIDLVSFGTRNVSSLEFDKASQSFLIKKTWTFFSDKIKIISENNGDVFFLNSDKMLCVTNLNNQSFVKVISEKTFDQAILVTEYESGIKFIAAECGKKLIIVQISKTELIHTWEIESDPIVSQFSLRGSYLIVYTAYQSLIFYFTNAVEGIPFKMVKVNFENLSALEVLSRGGDESLLLLTYNYSAPEGKICMINSAELTDHSIAVFADNTISQSKTQYGRLLCLSGKYFTNCFALTYIV